MSTAPVAIVSGAAQGLGRAFAKALAADGYQVLGFDRQPSDQSEPGVTSLQADVSRVEDVTRVVEQAARMGPVQVLINNAGTWRRTPADSNLASALADYDFIMNTNVKGVLMLSRAAMPHLIENGGGHIINISSYYVLPARSAGTNQPDTDLYNASKWALNGFTDAWAKTLAAHNICVNGMCMGAVDTPMLRGLFPDNTLPAHLDVMQPQALAQQMLDIMASGRSGENFGAWVGETLELAAQPPMYQRITG